MIEVVLLLGGNQGDMLANIRAAITHINSRIGSVIESSKLYTSEAWGFESDMFYNQVVVVDTALRPEQILERIWEIERLFGRDRGDVAQELERYRLRKAGVLSYSPRAMDIDILYYGDEKISTELLTIPHPLIQEREFVMIPLRELGRLK